MPSYCCAVNCKNNGASNPDLSFFRFPEHSTELRDKWIKVVKRKNWKPTIHSRICSVHFEQNCFFLRRGTRLRLLPTAVPSIFDFRKIGNNRKKAETYLDMTETECPDPELYELKTEPVMPIRPTKYGQKCKICNESVDCKLTIDSMILTKRGQIEINHIISTIGNIPKDNLQTAGHICLACSERLVDAYVLRCELDECGSIRKKHISDNVDKNKMIIELNREEVANEETIEHPTDSIKIEDNINSLLDTEACNNSQQSIYCQHCNINFSKSNLSDHLSLCKMKKLADSNGYPTEQRKLIVCWLCNTMIYAHNVVIHLDNCKGVTD